MQSDEYGADECEQVRNVNITLFMLCPALCFALYPNPEDFALHFCPPFLIECAITEESLKLDDE